MHGPCCETLSSRDHFASRHRLRVRAQCTCVGLRRCRNQRSDGLLKAGHYVINPLSSTPSRVLRQKSRDSCHPWFWLIVTGLSSMPPVHVSSTMKGCFEIIRPLVRRVPHSLLILVEYGRSISPPSASFPKHSSILSECAPAQNMC